MAAVAPTQQHWEAFEDVALYFTRKEWELLGDGDKVLYRDQMLRNYQALLSLGYQGPTPDLICRIQRGEVELWVCDDKDPGESTWSKNLSPDFSDSWDSLAEDNSVGSFPGPGSSVQSALSGSISQRMSPLDPTKRAPNWSRGEVLDLIAIWGEVRRTVATAAKGTKGNRQNQAICERIAVQMVARGHQRDWLQVRTKIKSLKSLYVRGRDAKRMPGAAKNTIPFHKELADILERDYAVAPCHTVQCTALDQQEVDSGGAASSQQLPAAPQESCEDLVSSMALILSPITEPGTQEALEVAPGQNGCKSEVTEIEHPSGNLSDFSDTWDPLAEDSSVGSFPGPDPSVQAALSASMSQRMSPLDSVRRAPNWSHGEVLDLITIWGEVRRAIATAAKGTKGNRQKQAVCERIAAQMVARGHQRDWLQVRTKIKSLKSLYVRGKDASRVPGAARNTIPFHKELADILERDHIVAPHHMVRCTASGHVCYDQEEGDNSEAASSQQLPSAPQESCEDLVSSVALSPIAEPGTQETREVAPGQDGCKSEVPESEHPAGNLFGIREICNSFAEDSSVGSFPGSGPSVQAAHSGSISQKMIPLDSVRRAPNWSHGEVLDLITIWGEMRRTIAAAGKRTKGNRQKQAVCEMIAAQMVAQGHQRDWLQVRTKIKSLKSLYVRGRDAKRVPGAAKSMIPFHKELADILERDHAVTPRCTVQRTALDQQEGDSSEAASSQHPPAAPQENCEDLVSSVALILSPITEPGTQVTQEVAPGQDGCKSEVPESEHPAGNLSDFSDAWNSLADDSSVGSFPGPDPSVQADYLGSMNQRMPFLDPIKRAPNWSHGEVLDLIAIWGEMRRTIATAAKGTKGNRQKQAVCERIAAQMVAWGHQRDWLQVRTKIKSLKSLYVRGKDAKRVPGAAKNAIPFHKELADILEEDHIVAPCHTVQCTALGSICCDQQEGDSGEAASSQQLPAAPQEGCGDLVSSVALILSPVAEPGMQETQEVAPGQDGCKSEVPESEHPAGNLSDFSDAWDSLAEDSSVGSFPGSGPSLQAAHSGSISQKMTPLDSVRRAPNWSHGEVLDLIAIWGEMRRTSATAGKGSKGNRQKQAICERIAAQMVSRGHQRDWLQVRTKMKSLKSLYVKGRDANRVPGAAKNTIPFHKELADILERDRTVAPCYTVRCTALGPSCCDQQEGDSGEAASSQQFPAALQERSEDLVSSVALILSPIAEPGTQETQEVAPRQDGCKSEVPEIEHPAGNLSDFSDAWISLAEDSSVGSFPGTGPSVQAAHLASMSQKMPTLDSVKRAPNWSRDEVLDLIAIWGEMRRAIATAAKGTKGNRQNQAICERIAAQMVSRGHQRDWLQVRTKIKSLKSLYVRGRDASRVPGAAKNTIPFHKEIADILERDHAVAPRHRVQCTALGPSCCDQQEGDSGEAASSHQPSSAHQRSCEDLVSSVALILSPITEPGTQETREVAPRQDGCKSEVPEIERPGGNLFGNPTDERGLCI